MKTKIYEMRKELQKIKFHEYTQEKCAIAIGVSRETLRRYENGKVSKIYEEQIMEDFFYEKLEEEGISTVDYEPRKILDKPIHILDKPNSRIIPKPSDEKDIRILEHRYNARIPTVNIGSLFFYFEAESDNYSQIITEKSLDDNNLSILDIIVRVEKQMIDDVHLRAYYDYELKNEITEERVFSETIISKSYIVSYAKEYEAAALLLHPQLENIVNLIYKGKGCYIHCMRDRLVLNKMSESMSTVDYEKYLNDIGENEPNYISMAIPFRSNVSWWKVYCINDGCETCSNNCRNCFLVYASKFFQE